MYLKIYLLMIAYFFIDHTSNVIKETEIITVLKGVS